MNSTHLIPCFIRITLISSFKALKYVYEPHHKINKLMLIEVKHTVLPHIYDKKKT